MFYLIKKKEDTGKNNLINIGVLKSSSRNAIKQLKIQ